MRLGRMVTYLRANKSLKLSLIIVQLLFMLILLIHWIACIWYGIITFNDGKKWTPPKDLDWNGTIIYDQEQRWGTYSIFFYYSILTLVTNELMPTDNVEVITASMILIIGTIVTGVLIGEFSNAINDMNTALERSNEELESITGIMMGLELPEEIHNNVIEYYNTLHAGKYIYNPIVYDYLNKCVVNTIKLYQVEVCILKSKLCSSNNRILINQIAEACSI